MPCNMYNYMCDKVCSNSDIGHQQCCDEVKEAKLHYEKKLVNQINVNDKRFWNYTRHFTKLSSTIGDLNFEGKNFSDDQTKANILNNYFISVLTDESGSLHSLPTLHTDVKYTL